MSGSGFSGQRGRPNRTTVGLKVWLLWATAGHINCPNRTTVGLKDAGECGSGKGSGMSQSHHSGIESCEEGIRTMASSESQSHHSGIERLMKELLELPQHGPNRTTVGLKGGLLRYTRG